MNSQQLWEEGPKPTSYKRDELWESRVSFSLQVWLRVGRPCFIGWRYTQKYVNSINWSLCIINLKKVYKVGGLGWEKGGGLGEKYGGGVGSGYDQSKVYQIFRE